MANRPSRVGTPKGRAAPPVARHPILDGGSKCALTVSATTVMRRREPTSDPHISRNMPNMVWDYQQQRHVWPNGKETALIEATQATGRTRYDTMNKSGKPFALGNLMVGGSPDSGGQPLGTQPTRPKKMLR